MSTSCGFYIMHDGMDWRELPKQDSCEWNNIESSCEWNNIALTALQSSYYDIFS